jgi:hypothetical protein
MADWHIIEPEARKCPECGKCYYLATVPEGGRAVEATGCPKGCTREPTFADRIAEPS